MITWERRELQELLFRLISYFLETKKVSLTIFRWMADELRIKYTRPEVHVANVLLMV